MRTASGEILTRQYAEEWVQQWEAIENLGAHVDMQVIVTVPSHFLLANIRSRLNEKTHYCGGTLEHFDALG